MDRAGVVRPFIVSKKFQIFIIKYVLWSFQHNIFIWDIRCVLSAGFQAFGSRTFRCGLLLYRVLYICFCRTIRWFLLHFRLSSERSSAHKELANVSGNYLLNGHYAVNNGPRIVKGQIRILARGRRNALLYEKKIDDTIRDKLLMSIRLMFLYYRNVVECCTQVFGWNYSSELRKCSEFLLIILQ